jgi:uncharacterized membrane protein YcaP (DUF421 family)
MLQSIFFHGTSDLVRTAIGTSVTYLALVVLLRVAGPRTLAKWYAFDLIVTVALGSTFANGVLSKDVSITQSVLGFVMLVALQFVVSWLIVRFGTLRRVVNPRPELLLFRGELRRDAMRRARVQVADVHIAIRGKGHARIEDVAAVVLEPDGTFSVIGKISERPTALADVRDYSSVA